MTPSDFAMLYAGVYGKAGMLTDSSTFNMTVSYQIDPLDLVSYTETPSTPNACYLLV
jgi:hypothetical protein